MNGGCVERTDLKSTALDQMVTRRREREEARRHNKRKDRGRARRELLHCALPEKHSLGVFGVITQVIDAPNTLVEKEKSRLYTAFLLGNTAKVFYTLEGITGSHDVTPRFFNSLVQLCCQSEDFLFPLAYFFKERPSVLVEHIHLGVLVDVLASLLEKASRLHNNDSLKLLIPSNVSVVLYCVARNTRPQPLFLDSVMPLVGMILECMNGCSDAVGKSPSENVVDLLLNGLELLYDVINLSSVTKHTATISYLQTHAMPLVCRLVEMEGRDSSVFTSEAAWLFSVYNKYFYSVEGFAWIRDVLLRKVSEKTDDPISFVIVMRHISETSTLAGGPTNLEKQLYAERIGPVFLNFRNYDIYVVEICLQILFNWGSLFLDEGSLSCVANLLRLNCHRSAQMVCVGIYYLACQSTYSDLMTRVVFTSQEKTRMYISAFTEFFRYNMYELSPQQALICLEFLLSFGSLIANVPDQQLQRNILGILNDCDVHSLLTGYAQKIDEERSLYVEFPKCEQVLDQTTLLYTNLNNTHQ